jgi:hypothetical protein
MPELGSTYRCNLPPRHIWIIISDPEQNDDRFVLVNLTSLTGSCVDDACILENADYPPYITQRTTVAYSRFKIGNVTAMQALLEGRQFYEMPDIPAETLQKIIDGAHNSPELPNTAKSMLPPPRPDV